MTTAMLCASFLYSRIPQMKKDEVRMKLEDSLLHSFLPCSHYLLQIHTLFDSNVLSVIICLTCA